MLPLNYSQADPNHRPRRCIVLSPYSRVVTEGKRSRFDVAPDGALYWPTRDIEWTEVKVSQTILAAPSSGTFSLEDCDGVVIRAMLARWLGTYDVIIADAPPPDRSNRTGLPRETLAAGFDCTILVVLSGEILLVQLKKAIDRLQEAGTVIGGIVMNDREMPSLNGEFGGVRPTGLANGFRDYRGRLNDGLGHDASLPWNSKISDPDGHVGP